MADGQAAEQRFTVRPPSRGWALVCWIGAAASALLALLLIAAVATATTGGLLWSVLDVLVASVLLVGAVVLALEAVQWRRAGTVVVVSERGLRVPGVPEAVGRRLHFSRWDGIFGGGAHRLAWDGIERFALGSRVEAVLSDGRRRRLAIGGSLPLVHWLNDMLVHYTTGAHDLPAPPSRPRPVD